MCFKEFFSDKKNKSSLICLFHLAKKQFPLSFKTLSTPTEKRLPSIHCKKSLFTGEYCTLPFGTFPTIAVKRSLYQETPPFQFIIIYLWKILSYAKWRLFWCSKHFFDLTQIINWLSKLIYLSNIFACKLKISQMALATMYIMPLSKYFLLGVGPNYVPPCQPSIHKFSSYLRLG